MKSISSGNADKIISLRLRGNSIPEISRKLQISKTTVFRYTKGLSIPEAIIPILFSKRGGSTIRKMKAEKRSYEEGKKLVGILTIRDKILFASALYWAEGNKKDLIITNTNPEIIRIFLDVMRQIFKVPEEKIWVGIRLYEDLDLSKCLSFWSDVTKINTSRFKVNILDGKKTGKLQFGMCRVRIKKGGLLLKKINGINKSVVDAFKT